jgi:hypothetical protein
MYNKSMQNTIKATELLKTLGLDVKITEGVLGKENFTHEGDNNNLTAQWVGIEANGKVNAKEVKVYVVILQDLVKNTDKIESAYYEFAGREFPLYARSGLKLQDLEWVL